MNKVHFPAFLILGGHTFQHVKLIDEEAFPKLCQTFYE
jgi:hypothetical protein